MTEEQINRFVQHILHTIDLENEIFGLTDNDWRFTITTTPPVPPHKAKILHSYQKYEIHVLRSILKILSERFAIQFAGRNIDDEHGHFLTIGVLLPKN